LLKLALLAKFYLLYFIVYHILQNCKNHIIFFMYYNRQFMYENTQYKF